MAEFNAVVAAAKLAHAKYVRARKAKDLPYTNAPFEGSWAHENEFFRSKGVF